MNRKWNLINLILMALVFGATAVVAGPVPDTGQTKCYNATGEIPCPQPGEPFYGQDGNYTINPPSYTKLDANGNALPDSAASWTMVRDNVTGLIWEIKTNESWPAIHSKDMTYNWNDAQSVFIASLNQAQFGGFSDWRLPNVKELSSIVNRGKSDPLIDVNYFPNTKSGAYWTETERAGEYGGTSAAWIVHFNYGFVDPNGGKDFLYSVRAVRGLQQAPNIFVNNNDGTITDASTGLMWQQVGATKRNWQTALQYSTSSSLVGYADWRLPTPTEYQSILDYSKIYPVPMIDIDAFPGICDWTYWTSTSWADLSIYAWLVDPGFGHVGHMMPYHNEKTYESKVLSVRGGQPLIAGHIYIRHPKQAEVWPIGSQQPIAWDTADVSGYVRISISRDGGKLFEVISDNVPNNGEMNWTVAGPGSASCALKIEPKDDPSKATIQSFFSIGNHNGSLMVTLAPQEAIEDGVRWRVDGGEWQASGTIVEGLFAGNHTIEFSSVPGWTTPSSQTVAVTEDQQISTTATYIQQAGSLQVTLSPQGAIDAGVQWRVENGEWHNSGDMISGLAAGQHEVSFSTISGWNTPANQTVTITDGQLTSTTATYIQQTGSLQVTIGPQTAIDAGAQWQVDGGAWQTSGGTVSGLTVGQHTVSFSSLAGWNTPANQTVTIMDGQLTSTSITYIQQTGSLQVTLSPQSAMDAGAQWRVAGGIWQASGATVSGLFVGPYTIEFSAIAGWDTPSSQTVTIDDNQTTTATANYVQQTGTLQVVITPEAAVSAGAKWRVDGGAWQGSGATVTGLSIGQHSIEFYSVSGWNAPASQNATINANQTTALSAAYVQQTGSLQVTISPQAAIDAGAQWRVDGGAWQNSGAVVSGLPIGQHTVEFAQVAGWTGPASQTVTINDLQTTVASGTYTVPVTGISGKVTRESGGQPVQGLWVYAYNYASGSWGGSAQTQADGSYTITGLQPGSYRINVNASGTNLIGEYYDNAGSSGTATAVAVAAGQMVSGIDFALAEGGQITGVVTRQSDGQPVQGVSVYAGGGSVQTQADGSYAISGLASGSYTVSVSTWNTGFYAVNPARTNVTVTAGQTIGGINFSGFEGGTVTGVVTSAATGEPLSGLEVSVIYDFVGGGLMYPFIYTQADGSYTVTGLTPNLNYLIQIETSGTNYARASQPVVIRFPAQVLSGINFSLSAGGSIAGIITDANNGQPLQGIGIVAIDQTTERFNTWNLYQTTTGSNGTYSISGLSPGTYKVSAEPPGVGLMVYRREYYDNTPQYNLATPVAVTAGQTTGQINFALDAGASISGTVTSEAGGLPLQSVQVHAYHADTGNYIGQGSSQADGTYTISGLAPGAYRLKFSSSGSPATEYYNNVFSFTTATPLSLSQGQALAGIDAALAEGGRITGRVSRESDGQPVANLSVSAYHVADPIVYKSCQTAVDGTYAISGLSKGAYYVMAGEATTNGTVYRYFNDSPTRSGATAVYVDLGQTTGDIDFALGATGKISGVVTRDSDGQPLMGILIEAYDLATGETMATANTDVMGGYTIKKLAPSAYGVKVSSGWPHGFAVEYFDNTYYPQNAAQVQVVADQTTTGIDFSLAQGATIKGNVYDGTGAYGLEFSVGVSAYAGSPCDQSPRRLTKPIWTEGNGYYAIYGLPPIDVYLRAEKYSTGWFFPGSNASSEWWAASASTPDCSGAQPVTVNAGTTITGKDFQLDTAGSISGRVFESDGVTPIYGQWAVNVYKANNGTLVDRAYIGPDGAYEIAGLPPGDYKVKAAPGTSHVHEFYNNAADLATAAAVQVLGGQASQGIDFTLGATGGIKGDLNADGSVTIADAILALQVLGGMNPSGVRADFAGSGADVNGDARIGAAELVYILQKVALLR